MKDVYVIVEAPSSEVLVERINQRIGIGFEPIGGVAVVCDSREEKCLCFYQSMIKKEESTVKKKE